MKKLLLALLLAAPYALLAGGAALWLHSEPWMVLVLWALIFLLIFAPAMVCAFLLPSGGWTDVYKRQHVQSAHAHAAADDHLLVGVWVGLFPAQVAER